MHDRPPRAPIPKFRVERRLDADGTARLVLHGDLDVATRDRLRSALRAEERAGRSVVVVLDHLEYLDSTGLGVLLEGHRRAQRDGRSFRTTPGMHNVRHVLAITGALDLLCPGADP